MEVTVTSLDDLAALAVRFVARFPRGATVGLSGDLGAGKTTFVRAVIAFLAAREGAPAPRVLSPTYVLQQSYPALVPPVEHFDLYRLEAATPAALLELGYNESAAECRTRGGFVFVEWPERAASPDALGLDARVGIAFHGMQRIIRIQP